MAKTKNTTTNAQKEDDSAIGGIAGSEVSEPTKIASIIGNIMAIFILLSSIVGIAALRSVLLIFIASVIYGLFLGDMFR